MQRRRFPRIAALLGVLSCSSFVACGSDSSGGSSGASSGSGAPAPGNGVFALDLGSTRMLGAHENGAMAALPDGDVFVAARTADTSAAGLFLGRVGPSGELRWGKTFATPMSTTIPSHVVVAGSHAYVIASSQSYESLEIFDVDPASGAVAKARRYKGSCGFPARARTLADGGLVVSCAGEVGSYVRLDAGLAVSWAKSGRGGGDVLVLSDGFAFAGVSSSLTPVNPMQTGGPQVGTGASLHMVDNAGASRGWHFMGPGPGTHTLAGARLLPNGNILLALGVDSTRSDSPAALSPLTMVTFGAEGSPVRMQRANMNVKTDKMVPLQFGGGRTMIARDDETWVGYIANSGRLGSDFRGTVVARFGIDGAVKDATFGGVMTAPTTGGAALAFTLLNGTFSFTRSAPGDATCVSRPTIEMVDITPYLDSKTAAEAPLTDVVFAPSDLTMTPVDVAGTTTGSCPSPL